MTTPNPYGPQPSDTPPGVTTPGTTPPGASVPGMPSPSGSPYGAPSYGTQPYGAAPYGAGAQDAPVAGPPAGSPYQAAYPYDTMPYRPTNQLAIVALILSLAGLATFFTAPAGAICGHIALGQIRRNPGQQGYGTAVAAIVSGWVITVLGLAAVAWFIWVITQLSTIPNQY